MEMKTLTIETNFFVLASSDIRYPDARAGLCHAVILKRIVIYVRGPCRRVIRPPEIAID